MEYSQVQDPSAVCHYTIIPLKLTLGMDFHLKYIKKKNATIPTYGDDFFLISSF